MAGNFLEQQDTARRTTIWLLVYLGLSMLALVAAFAVLAEVLLRLWPENLVPGPPYFGGKESENANRSLNTLRSYGKMLLTDDHLALIGTVSVGVLGVVGTGSLIKTRQLSSGGKAVAEMMEGKLVSGETTQASERMLFNVVEEMAMASGVPVPAVYVLENEEGINAFAAGYSTGDAVIAVSGGCLKLLTRNELQGVVAHEFSHILNGDMRLNIRLIGIVFGLLGLAQVGYTMFRVGLESGKSDPSSSSDKNAKKDLSLSIILVIAGLGIYLLGLLGELCGRLIQAAICRQREYLADASAVQFTRNPDGIAGALKKIGGYQASSRIGNSHAGEVNHLFLADAFAGKRFINLFATHPPLAERIRRIEPTFDGTFPKVDKPSPYTIETLLEKSAQGVFPNLPGLLGKGRLAGQPVLAGLAATDAVDSVGTVTPFDFNSTNIPKALPDTLEQAAREPFSARSVIYALLLDKDKTVRARQLSVLRAEATKAELTETLRLEPLARNFPDAWRLPLLDLSMPALRLMSASQNADFCSRVNSLVRADQNLSLFEYVLSCVLARHLDREYGRQGEAGGWWQPSTGKPPGMKSILALLAWQGAMKPDGQFDQAMAQQAFTVGMCNFSQKPDGAFTLPPRDTVGLADFHAAARALAKEKLDVRRRAMHGMAACILEDRQVTTREWELLRAIGETIDCTVQPQSPESPPKND